MLSQWVVSKEEKMSFDSEGNFTRLHNWEQDRLNDIGILSDRHDEEDNNFADGLNNCFLRDGRVGLSGALKMGGNQIKNLAAGTADGDAVNKSQVEGKIDNLKDEINSLLEENWCIGDIKASLQAANHGKWLLCDGQAVSRTTYADLFTLIGTNFGTGDGVTTFNVPDYRGKFLRGLGGNSAADVYTVQAEGLPNLAGWLQGAGFGVSGSDCDGTLFKGKGEGVKVDNTSSAGPDWQYSFDASAYNAIYGASSHVTPVNQAVNYFIKAL